MQNKELDRKTDIQDIKESLVQFYCKKSDSHELKKILSLSGVVAALPIIAIGGGAAIPLAFGVQMASLAVAAYQHVKQNLENKKIADLRPKDEGDVSIEFSKVAEKNGKGLWGILKNISSERESDAAARAEGQKQAAEVAARAEAQKQAAEVAARAEAQKQAAEVAARAEAQKQAAEVASRAEAEVPENSISPISSAEATIPAYDPIQALVESEKSRLAELKEEVVLRDRVEGETPEDTRAELLERANQDPDKALAEEKRLAELKEREHRAQAQGLSEDALDRQKHEAAMARADAESARLAALATNNLGIQPTGKELKGDEFIMPRRIANNYAEVDGKFFTKDTNLVAFQDKGKSIGTSTTDKKIIEDMVALAKAKQWNDLKLSGSPEFRREAWLQAQSQGINTTGYTPRVADLAALQTLTAERSTNTITPIKDRKIAEQSATAEAEKPAFRHDMNKNQAVADVEAEKRLAGNLLHLQKLPGMEKHSFEDMNALAYQRGMTQERDKHLPQVQQDEALARFDKAATDPNFVKHIRQETEASIEDKTTDRVKEHSRDTEEHSR